MNKGDLVLINSAVDTTDWQFAFVRRSYQGNLAHLTGNIYKVDKVEKSMKGSEHGWDWEWLTIVEDEKVLFDISSNQVTWVKGSSPLYKELKQIEKEIGLAK